MTSSMRLVRASLRGQHPGLAIPGMGLRGDVYEWSSFLQMNQTGNAGSVGRRNEIAPMGGCNAR